jgi:8-oxo-dGTP pyrophosphatase MutT (NUDIX family)
MDNPPRTLERRNLRSGLPLWTSEIQQLLRGYRFRGVDDPPNLPRAAVALVLRDGDRGSEFIAIHRAHRHGDPWSGHVALPGGRHQPGDSDLVGTAIRETREEIGVDLDKNADLVTELDELRAVGRGQLLDLVIRPVLFVLRNPVSLSPNPAEVQNALWIPLAVLRQDAHSTSSPRKPMGSAHPAVEFRGYTIWGLTHRILSRFVELVTSQRETPA